MSANNRVLVHEPDIGEEEIEFVVAALRRGEISGSFGTAIPEFEEKFAVYVGCKYGVAVTSGTTDCSWRLPRPESGKVTKC